MPAVAKKKVGMGSWAFVPANQYGKLSPGQLTYCSCIVLKLYRDRRLVGHLLGHRGFEPNEFFKENCVQELAGHGLTPDDVRAEIVAVGAASDTSFDVKAIKLGMDESALEYFGTDRYPVTHTDTLLGLGASCSELFNLSLERIADQAVRGTGIVTTPTVILQANNNAEFYVKGHGD